MAFAYTAMLLEYGDRLFDTSVPELMLFDPSVLGTSGTLRLVWYVDMTDSNGAPIDRQLLIDAHTGAVVRNYSSAHSALDREVYDAANTTANPGVLLIDEGDPPAALAEANSAYNFLGDTYDFYFDEHGRDSIDNQGVTLEATVRYCAPSLFGPCPWPNASYSPGSNSFFFGQGFAVDDVVAHEFTHGVIRSESGLIYANESGAINESLADIWGEFVDLSNGADALSDRWLHGEDHGSGARNMSNPLASVPLGQPDEYDGLNWVPSTTSPEQENDYGGVHTNSGVGNKLCYLLTDGDTFNGETVTDLGISKVADLYYEASTNLLTPGSDYSDLFQALTAAAVNLGWSGADRSNILRACRAVKIADTGRDFYVDGDITGPVSDGWEKAPFVSIAGALFVAFPGDRIHIEGGFDLPETPIIDIEIEFTRYGNGSAPVIIGSL